jgi:hypothetical protein
MRLALRAVLEKGNRIVLRDEDFTEDFELLLSKPDVVVVV